MSNRPIDHLPLRELILGAQQFSRELEEHLNQGFLPKVERLEAHIRPADQEKNLITDASVRRQVQEILESHTFAEQLMIKVENYLKAIDDSLQLKVLNQG